VPRLLAASAPDLFYARQQMAVSLGWHIVVASFGMVFPAFVFVAHRRWLATADPVWRTLADRWAKVMGVLFAVGAVSGTILSFELGILWPVFMGRFGDVFGIPFALEGFAFFVEAIFIGVYLYGRGRIPDPVHSWTLVPVFAAGMLSAFWVIAANGWMNNPTGFRVGANGEIVDVDPWAAVFNSALWHQFVHMALAAIMVVGFLTASVYAVPLLRGRATRYQRVAFTLAFSVAAATAPLQVVVGDWAARYVAEHQPVKLAAIEGLGRTRTEAPITLGGWYDEASGEVRGGISIPGALSFLVRRDTSAEIAGLDAVAPADRPPVNVVRIAFQLMVAIGFGLVALGAWFGLAWRRRRAVPTSRWFWRAAIVAGPASVVALLAGWTVTEVGRQPWIVHGVMRTAEAVNTASGLRYGYFALIGVYAALTFGTVLVLRRLAATPPVDAEAPPLAPQEEQR
jgi:cytochrome d ubiquinol oxidase subunit I